MAVYGISKEGADALKQLATDMSTLNNDIQECGQKLTAKVSGLGEGLGIYEEQILELMMPILESEDIVDYATRPSVLIQLKQKIDDMKDHVLNVRVGGNDFSNAFGVRRHIDETIYDILPVSQLLCDILTVFSRDYVVSGPVWEYYSSNNDEWAIGLKRELKYDVLNGFVGKTVIHPNQIPVVVDSLKVKKQDYDDAMEILSWRDDSALLVGGSAQKERMNEVNTHLRWAKRVASLAAVYGVQND